MGISCGARQIQAHKLILSACSPFFRTVLKQNPHQHPLLYLKGVEFTDLQSVLNFMYHGEVNVAQEELNSFLSVAEDLQVKGLTQNKSLSQASPQQQKQEQPKPRFSKQHSNNPATSNPVQRVSKPNTYDHQQQQDEDDVQELSVPEIKKEPQTSQQAYIAPDPLIQQHMNTTNTNRETHDMSMQMATTTEESYMEEEYEYGQYDEEVLASYQAKGMDTNPNQGAGDTSSYITSELNEDGGKLFTCQLC